MIDPATVRRLIERYECVKAAAVAAGVGSPAYAPLQKRRDGLEQLLASLIEDYGAPIGHAGRAYWASCGELFVTPDPENLLSDVPHTARLQIAWWRQAYASRSGRFYLRRRA